MSARDNILNAIKANKPLNVALPVIDNDIVIKYHDNQAQFKQVLESIGASVIELGGIEQLQVQLAAEKAGGQFVINLVEEIGETSTGVAALSPRELAGLQKAYLRGSIAVAENGAIWLYEQQMVNRLVPFICEYLILVIDRKDIVATMHQALEKINIAAEGFGVFLAGPSKTADIEQSLVIGAHGARGLTVFISN